MRIVRLMLVLACVVLAGFTPDAKSSEQGSSMVAAEPCLPTKMTCIVSVGGVLLIRAPGVWLLDLGGQRKFDVAAVIRAAEQCDGLKGCGVPMTGAEIEALVGELAQAKNERLPIKGGAAVAYRLAGSETVIQTWGDLPQLKQTVPQLSPVPPPGCLGCGICLPGQCEGPPPVPIRIQDLPYY